MLSIRKISPVLALLVSLSALFLSGCVTISKDTYANMVKYDPAPSPARFDVSYHLTTVHTVSPECAAVWRKWGNTDEGIVNYRGAMSEMIGKDIIQSGLLARLVGPKQPADIGLKIESTDAIQGKNYVLLIAYSLSDARTQHVINHRTLTVTYGPGILDVKINERLPGAMVQIKQSIADDLKGYLYQRHEKAAAAEAELLTNAKLADLLVASDQAVSTARARNRAIIAAKTTQLPDLLRNTKTDELTALVVKIEQTMLDLNHNSEVAKDRAQQAAASGESRQIEGLRELAICYRERIELLKPISAAIKEEIANRNR